MAADFLPLGQPLECLVLIASMGLTSSGWSEQERSCSSGWRAPEATANQPAATTLPARRWLPSVSPSGGEATSRLEEIRS